MEPTSQALPNPLDALSGSGKKRVALRLLLVVVVVGLVVHFAGPSIWTWLQQPQSLPFVVAGAFAHLTQRAVRIVKWHAMMKPSGLVPRSIGYLLRIQLIGMLANLALPVSEAFKVWAVSRDRRDAGVAAILLVNDTSLHATGMGIASLLIWPFVDLPRAAWIAAVVMVVGGIGGIIVGQTWLKRRERAAAYGPTVLLFNAFEVVAQLATYWLAFRAVEVSVSAVGTTAAGSLLYVGDIFMLTPMGVGVREGLFSAVSSVTDTTTEQGAIVGFAVTAMIFAASVGAGTTALLISRASDNKPKSEAS